MPLARPLARIGPTCALACAVMLAACGSHATGASDATAARATVPDGDWLQFNYDAQRSGVGPARTGISSGNAHTLKLRIVHLPGTADSSPVQVHAVKVKGRARDVVILTTSYGRTIAVDPGTGKRLWEFVPKDIHRYAGSAQLTNASPTVDPDRRYVYASSPDGVIHKLVVATGRQVWARSVTYDPTHEKLASPPTVSGNLLVVETDGYIGDAPPYQGHVLTLERSTGRIAHVWNSLCSDRHKLIVPRTCGASDSAMWGRAGAVLVPGSRRILVATGNGPFNGRTNWGDSVLELTSDATHLLHNWTPRDQAYLSSHDQDLGSTSPAILPDPGGPPLLLQGGKSGELSLLDLDRLDGTTGRAGARTGGELQTIPAPNHAQVFTAPAVWVHGGRTYVFVADYNATSCYILHSGRQPRLTVLWSRNSPGNSPVLAGGLLYVYDEINGRLNIRNPTSGNGLASLRAATGHWNSPIVIGGRVILPTGDADSHPTSGSLSIYYLPRR